MHTHFHRHTYTEEEPRLPWVNWGRGLAKSPGGKRKVLRLRAESYFSAKPDRAEWSSPRWQNLSEYAHQRDGKMQKLMVIKNERNHIRAYSWHTLCKHWSTKTVVLFLSFQTLCILNNGTFFKKRNSHSIRTVKLCHLPLNHFYSWGWVSKNNYKEYYELLFICPPLCAWLAWLSFFCFVLQYVCTYLVKSQCYFSNYFKNNNIEWSFQGSNISFELLLRACVCTICMFVFCLHVCVRGPLLINVTSHCNGACWTCSDICNALPVSAWFYCHGLIGYCHYHNLD